MDISTIIWSSVYALLPTVFVLYLDHKLIPRTSKKNLYVVRWILLYLITPLILSAVVSMLIYVLMPVGYEWLYIVFVQNTSTEAIIAPLLSGWLLRTKRSESSGGHINLHKKRIALVIISYVLMNIYMYQTHKKAKEIEDIFQRVEQGEGSISELVN